MKGVCLRRRLSCAAALAAAVGGCGPSVQSIREGNIRFEHCYRLDLDQNIARTHRLTCWRQWVDSYAYGQTRDKIEYARRRARYLAAGSGGATRLDLSGKTPSESAGTRIRAKSLGSLEPFWVVQTTV